MANYMCISSCTFFKLCMGEECHLNAEQLVLCMLLLNLCPGKLVAHSNLKYTYTCKTMLVMITFIMFERFLYYFANVLLRRN